MTLNLNKQEITTLLSWRHEAETVLPNEQVLIDLLKKHSDGDLELTDNQLVIISSWAESSVDGNFGSGAITNITEKQLLEKIKAVYSAIPSSKRVPAGNMNASLEPVVLKVNTIKKRLIILGVLVVVWGIFQFMKPKAQVSEVRHDAVVEHSIIVDYLVGDVSFKRAGSEWRQVMMNTKFLPEDSIKTGIGSKLQASYGSVVINITENKVVRLYDLLK